MQGGGRGGGVKYYRMIIFYNIIQGSLYSRIIHISGASNPMVNFKNTKTRHGVL